MTRRVDDDIGALGRAEEDLGRVDGDALIAFGLEGVEQEGPFERAAALIAGSLKFGKLAFRQAAGVMEQAADQCGFAVIDMADDRERKTRLVGRHVVIGVVHARFGSLERKNGHRLIPYANAYM